MGYVIRNESGVLIMKVSNMLAGNMIEEFNGRWTTKNFSRGKKDVYVLEGEYSFGGSDLPFKVMLWSGYYICKE